MYNFVDISLTLVMLLFFAIQWHLTLFGGFLWPFSSHRLFSQLPPKNYKTVLQVVVTDQHGNNKTVHPGQVLPLEYARCSGLLRQIYYYGTHQQRKYLYNYMLDVINHYPWKSCDEMMASVKSSSMFVSLSIEEHTLRLEPGLPIISTKILYPSNRDINDITDRTLSYQRDKLIVWWSLVGLCGLIIYCKNYNIILDLPFAKKRIKLLQQIVSLMICILLRYSSYQQGNFYPATSFFLFKRSPWISFIIAKYWKSILFTTTIFAIMFGLQIYEKIFGPLLCMSWWILQWYITQCSTTYWITNTHTNWLILYLSVLPFFSHMPIYSNLCSATLIFAYLYVTTLYLQAGISKLLLGGIQWFTQGERIYVETLLLGTPFGKWLTVKYPFIFTYFGLGTAIVEILVPFLLLFPNTAIWAAIMLIGFHISIYSVMGISFWFLWILYPPLYFYSFIFS